MALWLVRTGRQGQFEIPFFENNRIYLTWGQIQEMDLAHVEDTDAIYDILRAHSSEASDGRLQNWSRQILAFISQMKKGDWVVAPRKSASAIAVGEITSDHLYDPKAERMFRHYREVRWISTDVPRSSFPPDILQSMNALMTICQISRNNAEARIRDMAVHNWTSSSLPTPRTKIADGDDVPDTESMPEFYDLERSAGDQIATLIERRFTGHDLARLVDAMLIAQGYTTHLSPPGPDGGVDILAGTGAMGFGTPRLCVQVKSGKTPVERKVLNELVGTMQAVHAEQGLLVSWSGFKDTVSRETATQFFRVRFWNADTLIEELFACYDKLEPAIRAELPLKRIWCLAVPEDQS